MSQYETDFSEAGTPLGSNAHVAGNTHDAQAFRPVSGLGQAKFRAFVSADQAGTLAVEQSADGNVWFETTSVAVAAASTRTNGNPTATILESIVTLRYVRAHFFNGATAQGSFAFSSALVAV